MSSGKPWTNNMRKPIPEQKPPEPIYVTLGQIARRSIAGVGHDMGLEFQQQIATGLRSHVTAYDPADAYSLAFALCFTPKFFCTLAPSQPCFRLRLAALQSSSSSHVSMIFTSPSGPARLKSQPFSTIKIPLNITTSAAPLLTSPPSPIVHPLNFSAWPRLCLAP